MPLRRDFAGLRTLSSAWPALATPAAFARGDIARLMQRCASRMTEGSPELVGADAASAPLALLCWVAPLAAALVGKDRGDRVAFQRRPIEVVGIASGQ